MGTLIGVVIGVHWIVGRVSGVCSCCRVSFVQKLPLATLAMLIAISMLATHTWHAIVGPQPSAKSLLCCLEINPLLM